MTHVWTTADDVRGAALLVLLALADCANDDGRCWPSLAYLADRSTNDAPLSSAGD